MGFGIGMIDDLVVEQKISPISMVRTLLKALVRWRTARTQSLT